MTIPPITLPERCLFRRAESDKGHRVTSGAYDDSISQSGRNICCGIKTWHARRSKEVQVDVEIATGTFWNDRRDKKDEGCGLMNPSSLEQMVGWLVGWLLYLLFHCWIWYHFHSTSAFLIFWRSRGKLWEIWVSTFPHLWRFREAKGIMNLDLQDNSWNNLNKKFNTPYCFELVMYVHLRYHHQKRVVHKWPKSSSNHFARSWVVLGGVACNVASMMSSFCDYPPWRHEVPSPKTFNGSDCVYILVGANSYLFSLSICKPTLDQTWQNPCKTQYDSGKIGKIQNGASF